MPMRENKVCPYSAIEGKVWIKDDGRKVRSLANPWTSEADKKRWRLVSKGWYIRNPECIGWQDRPPYKTRKDAQQEADRRNKEFQYSLESRV